MDKDVKELWDFLNKASSDRDVQVEKLEKRVEELEQKLSVYNGGGHRLHQSSPTDL